MRNLFWCILCFFLVGFILWQLQDNHLAILPAIYICLFLLNAVITDLGLSVWLYSHNYRAGILILKFAHGVNTTVLFLSGYKSFTAGNIASAYLELGDFENAEYWGKYALSCPYTQKHFERASDCHLILGRVAFFYGKLNHAEEHLSQVAELCQKNISDYSDYNMNEAAEYHALSLHYLGLIKLIDGKTRMAKNWFENGIDVRRKTPSLKETADAYASLVDGMLAMKEEDNQKAMEAFYAAVSKLPEKVSLYQHRHVLFELERAIQSLSSVQKIEDATRLKLKLEDSYRIKLYPNQKRLLVQNRPYLIEPQFIPELKKRETT